MKEAVSGARKVFDRMVASLNDRKWHFEQDTSDGLLCIRTTAVGEDLPVKLFIYVDEDRELLSVRSTLPFAMSKDKLVEGAVAICIINDVLANGCFKYDVHSGEMVFKVSAKWSGGLIDDSVFSYLIDVTCGTVDEYNDKLLMVSKGSMDMNAFYKFVNED